MEEFSTEELVNLKYSQAIELIKKMGYTFRVDSIDGLSNIKSMDWDPRRVNLVVSEDVVVSAYLS